MLRPIRCAVVAAVMTVTTSATAPGDAASTVQKTKPDCITAWATLMTSHPSIHSSYPHAAFKEAVLNVTGPSSRYQAGESQTFQLFTFDTRFVEGGTSYVARCGHGATCNALGDAIVKRYPAVGTVYVYCTNEPPHVLENPQAF